MNEKIRKWTRKWENECRLMHSYLRGVIECWAFWEMKTVGLKQRMRAILKTECFKRFKKLIQSVFESEFLSISRIYWVTSKFVELSFKLLLYSCNQSYVH